MTSTGSSDRRPTASRALPGSRSSCALLTLFTVLLAWPSPPVLRVVVLPAYFALLVWFFCSAGRGRDAIQGQAMRLVQWGFIVLWLGFTASAIVHFTELDAEYATFVYLRQAAEHGALFLLGVTLIAYGLMLWIPRVIAANEILARDLDQQASELVVAETELSELERRLVEVDRRAILGELAASIAHDLRNPLAIVVGTAESLCRRQRSADEIAEHTDVIRRNIDKASHTLSSLIDLGRPRAIQFELVSAHDIVDEVLGLVRTEARRRQVELLVHGADTDARIHGDRNLLAQALLNLVLNAMQAAAAGTAVTVRVRAIGGGVRARTAIAVEDRGAGVEAPVRMRQFMPFHTTRPDGTGLGLWSCRRIADELGGALALYPRRRGGARVVLVLPALPPPASRDEPRPEETACPIAAS